MGKAAIPPQPEPVNAAGRDPRRPSRFIARPADDRYPAPLRDLQAPPGVIYAEGSWDLDGPRIAVVGSRNATEDGKDFAEWIAAELAASGIAILSGLARGIDAAAHRGALRAGGRTGAVLGTSLDGCFPAEHAELQSAVARSLGILTEVPPGAPPTRATFATRNRIVAALAEAVILVQGEADSGSLITAKAAQKLGRPVGAVPWDPRERLAEAPLALLRAQGAVLVRNADDVMEMLGVRRSAPVAAAPAAESDASHPLARGAHETLLYEALRNLPQPLESAARRAGLGIAEAGAALVTLELLGRARREPGGTVRRVRAR